MVGKVGKVCDRGRGEGEKGWWLYIHIWYEATEGMIEFEQSVCDIAAVLLFVF